VSERRVDLSLSNSMRGNERSESSRKLLNDLGGRFFIIKSNQKLSGDTKSLRNVFASPNIYWKTLKLHK